MVWAIVYFGFSFDGLYGQDAYEYLRYTESLKAFLTTGKNPGDYFWGVYYPIFGSILSFITPNIPLALQLISVFSLVITSLHVDKIIGVIYKENASQNISFLIFTLSPIVLIHSVLAMSDLLSCCFVTIAYYLFLQFLETTKNKHFLIGIALGCIAIFTRYASVVALLPIGLVVLFRILKNRNYKLLLFSIGILGIITIPHLVVRSQNSLQFLNHQWLQSWNIFNLLQSDFNVAEDETRNHFINLIYIGFQVLHPIFLFFGVILIAFTLIKRKLYCNYYQKLLLLSIVFYALFLGGIPFQNKRFLLLTFPIVIVFLYPYLKSLLHTFSNQKLVFALIFVIQISLGINFGKKIYDRNLLEKNVSKEMKQYEGKILYAFDIDIALQGRKVAMNYKSLYVKKYSRFEKNALILINEKEILDHWKGANPFINWSSIQEKCVLFKLKTFNNDWNLYQIQSSK